jgi:hypothetical protein
MGWQDDPVVPGAAAKPAWESDPIVKSADSGEKPEVGGLESFGRGAAQAFGLGYSPQLIAAAKTMNLPGSEDPAYLAELKKQKAATEQAWEQHPWLYGTGMVASAIPAAAGAILGAPEAAAAGTIGSLGGAGLRALAGEGAGMLPTALRGAAKVAENPVVQGAVFGSSEGESLADKATGAAAGAIGAKVAPAVLGAVGSGVKAVGQKIAPDIVDPIFHALTGNPSTAKNVTNWASDLNLTLPSAAVSEGGVSKFVSRADVLNQIPNASKEHLNQIGSKIENYVGNVEQKDTGASIRSAIQNWATDATKPTGFEFQMSKIFEPIRVLESSNAVLPVGNLQSAIVKQAQSPSARVSPNVGSTLDIANQVLDLNARNKGLTFAEMKAFKKTLSDAIDWNQAPGTSGINNNILKELRASLNKDMEAYAKKFGSEEVANAYSKVNANAENLYKQRSSIFKLTGNPVAGGPGSKNDAAIYNNIVNAASKKGGGNIYDLSNLQKAVSTYDPEAWQSVGMAYSSKFIPNGEFSYNAFNKAYDNFLHSEGKDLLFGQAGSGGIRDTVETIRKIGATPVGKETLGSRLDNLARRAAPPTSVGILETALTGGVPWKTIATGGLGSVAGAIGARNVAAPMSQYAPSTGAKIAGETIKGAAPIVGAELAAKSPLPGAIKGGVPLAVYEASKQLPSWLYNAPGISPTDTRMGRKSGGRVSDRLVAMVDRSKKNINNSTQSLLQTPDSHVAHALEIANRNLEG